MVDIFNEIDDELRRDKLSRFWNRHAGKVLALLVVAVLVTGGLSYRQYQINQAGQDAAKRLNDISKLTKDGKNDEVEKALQELSLSKASGYQLIARFRLAAEIGKRDMNEGVKAFKKIAEDASLHQNLRDFATLRAVMLNFDTVSFQDTRIAMGALDASTHALRNGAREVLGLAAFKEGLMDDAGRYFDLIQIDPQATASMRSRVEVYSELVRAAPKAKPNVKSGS